jgi:hypothetical protein
VSCAADFAHADRLIFPGVGAFGACMDRLAVLGYIEPLKAYLASGKPFLGICLGMQTLFAGSLDWVEVLFIYLFIYIFVFLFLIRFGRERGKPWRRGLGCNSDLDHSVFCRYFGASGRAPHWLERYQCAPGLGRARFALRPALLLCPQVGWERKKMCYKFCPKLARGVAIVVLWPCHPRPTGTGS